MNIIPEYEIKTADGHKIFLDQLVQYKTYRGMLAGVPCTPINQKEISDAIKNAKSKIFGASDPYVIDPETTIVEVDQRTEDAFKKTYGIDEIKFERLPPVVCTAQFESNKTVRDTSGDYSFLTVIWFQEYFALPIDGKCVDCLSSLSWDKHAANANL